ncbi:hypothetical protein C922_04512 [Plasmodium inui San Antonio 1]|uniref:Uncharacterized protein n=1 Tax=Plasmodium inui San Antonio 1 TaxID=1237626 RepID=W6ZWF9_9APIC|nr:hypothetical protein C922_04512 [Plasmodium inui San Antonio 1]EUD65112.1 hypothetical protein C922_04512 [Plasmodium inui San Antonio 1]
MKKTNFSEKMNSFLENKKKREEDLSVEKEKKKKNFDKSNFTERRNDELAKNDVHVIAGGKVTHRTDNIAQVMRYVEEHAEGRSACTLDEENESKEQYDDANGGERQREGSRTRYNHARDTEKIEGNRQTEPTISKESAGPSGEHTDEHSLHNAISSPMEKMRKLRIESTHRYLSKVEDDSYRLIKDYRKQVDTCIEQIKRETFLKANLLKTEMESILAQVERLTQEGLELKWEGDPSQREKNSDGKMKNNHFYVTYYTVLMELKLCEKLIPTSHKAVDAPQMSSTLLMKDSSENTKECILKEIKKEVHKKREMIEEKWECVQNLFTNLNEKIKKFISHFEKKHERVIKGMSDNTQHLEEKMKDKIFFSTEEASQLIRAEMERGKQFFLDFLTHFNDYVTKTYNYVYDRYHRCEYVFFRDILHEPSYRDICCVYSTISQNYLNGLSTDRVLNRLIAMFEDNYNAVYARRVGLAPDEFFKGFLAAQEGGAAQREEAEGAAEAEDGTNNEAAKHPRQQCVDIYQKANQNYEEYLTRYEEIKTGMVRYREVVLHTFFHLDNFAAAVGGGRRAASAGEAANTTATATDGGGPPWRGARKKALRKSSPKWPRKAKCAEKAKRDDTTSGGAHMAPERDPHGEVKREDHPEREPSIREHHKEGNLPEFHHMEEDPNGVTQQNDEHTHEIILAQVPKDRSVFKKLTNNILTHYNMLNFRDDYFILSFFSILETLKSDILLMRSHVERKIKEFLHQCSQQNGVFISNFDTLLREYNSVVKKCLQCKDHLRMRKLLAIKDQAKRKLESYVTHAGEEACTINETLFAESKRLWGDFFFAALSKAKVISTESESLSLRKANRRCGINDTPGEGKHTDIKGQQKTNINENERNIIRQLVGQKHSYTYDEETIWHHTYISYRGNMMELLHPARDTGAGLERGVKGKTRPSRETGKKTSYAAQRRESTIKSNIAQIRRDYIQQKGEEAKRGNSSHQEVNPGGNHSGETSHSLPQLPKLSLPDELLFNEDLLKQLFQRFTSTYYQRFKEILFENLLKAKMRSERESTKCFQKMEADKLEEQLQRDEEKIKEIAIKLEEEFEANKKTFDDASKKLSELVKEYEQVTKEDWEDYRHFKETISLMEKMLQENTDQDDRSQDQFTGRYTQLLDSFKVSFKSIKEKLLCGEKKLRAEIKKVETYCTMLVRTGQTNVDLDTIEAFLHNSNQLLLSIEKKRQDVENVFSANQYIFNNNFRAIASRSANRSGSQSGTTPPPPDRQMLHYLITKEEIKNNLLIFYLLVYQIRVCIGQSSGQTGGVPYPAERKANHSAYTSKASLKMEKSSRASRAASMVIPVSPVRPLSPVSRVTPVSPISPASPVHGANLSSFSTPPRTHQINLQDKFTHVQNCIYQIGTFRKIEKRYELDLAREDSIVSNFSLSRMIGPHLPHLVFSKGSGLQESPVDYLSFGLFDKQGGSKGGEEEQQAAEEQGAKRIHQMGNELSTEASSSETVPPEKCTPKPGAGAENETTASNTKTNVSNTKRITPSGMKVKGSGKGASEMGTKKHTRIGKETHPQEGNNSKKSEPNIEKEQRPGKDHPPDASSYAENEIIRRDYLDVKFFLYTCMYIIHLISTVVQRTPSKGFPKESQPKYNHSLFISYDLSHVIYKNNILKENLNKKEFQLTDLVVNKKAMSSFVFCPDHVSRRTELIHLFKFEKKTVSELFERTFSQLHGLHSVTTNDIYFGKIHSEYAKDMSTLATYLKVLSKKAAYFTFRCVYKRHESLCTERINTMQKNLLQKFKELNERLKVTDTGDNTASHVRKRKEAIKCLFDSYVSAIRGLLTNHLSYLYDNLCNNVIFFIHVLILLPAGSSSTGSTPSGKDPPPEKASAKGAGNVTFLKIHHVDMSADYDLSDIVKKIDKAYGPTGHHRQADSGAKQNASAEMLYLPYSEENLYIAKKLEHKMNKYGGRLYAHMRKALDGKKKEIIKIISNDVREHRRYYE